MADGMVRFARIDRARRRSLHRAWKRASAGLQGLSVLDVTNAGAPALVMSHEEPQVNRSVIDVRVGLPYAYLGTTRSNGGSTRMPPRRATTRSGPRRRSISLTTPNRRT